MEVKDKAGLPNVVADHVSCLGPETTPSEDLPMDDSFPVEQLFAISHQVTPWYADLVNFKVCRVLPPGLSYQQRKKFLPNPNTMCRKSLFFTSCVEMGSIEDAYRKMRFVVSYTIAMLQPMVETLDRIRQLQRYSKQAFIGPCFSRMQENL